MERVGLLEPHLPVKEWNKENVCEWMYEVRKAGGIPMFKTKYAGVGFTQNGERCVLGIGWGAEGKASSMWFCGIPEEELKDIEEKPADFNRLYQQCPANIKAKIQQTLPPY